MCIYTVDIGHEDAGPTSADHSLVSISGVSCAKLLLSPLKTGMIWIVFLRARVLLSPPEKVRAGMIRVVTLMFSFGKSEIGLAVLGLLCCLKSE